MMKALIVPACMMIVILSIMVYQSNDNEKSVEYRTGIVESHYVVFDNSTMSTKYLTVVKFGNGETKLIEEGSEPKLFLHNIGTSVKINTDR